MPPSSISASSVQPLAGETTSGGHSPSIHGDSGNVPLWRSGVVLLLAVVVGLSYYFNPPIDVQPQAGVIMDLPVFVGDFFGQKGEITEAELLGLPKDTQFARRNYADSHGNRITCTIVLSGAEQRSIHRPEACMEGQGWTITHEQEIPVPLVSGHPLKAEEITLERRVTIPSGDHITVRAFYDYWFVGQNVVTSSEMKRVLMSNWDRVIHNHAHRWAYVSLFSLITDNLQPNGLNNDQTRAMIVGFARQAIPSFQISEMPAQAQN